MKDKTKKWLAVAGLLAVCAVLVFGISRVLYHEPDREAQVVERESEETELFVETETPEPVQAQAPLAFELQASAGVLRVLSRNDQLSITGVTVNRGQCKVHEQTMGYDAKGNRIGYVPVFPLPLAFGKQARFTMPLCRVLEVVIHTDRGDAGYTFE